MTTILLSPNHGKPFHDHGGAPCMQRLDGMQSSTRLGYEPFLVLKIDLSCYLK